MIVVEWNDRALASHWTAATGKGRYSYQLTHASLVGMVYTHRDTVRYGF